MKKGILVLLFLTSGIHSFSQNIFQSNGKVGIKTSSPIENLTVNGSFGTNGYKIFSSANSTSGAGLENGFFAILNNENGDTLNTAWRYKVFLVTRSTGTDSGSSFLVYFDETNQSWHRRVISVSGTGSNHPLLDLEGGNQVKIYTNHTNSYPIGYTVESFKVTEADATPHIFGGDYQWQRFSNDLKYSDGNVGIGRTPETLLHLSSEVAGDAVLTIQSDSDNNNEGDNPKIEFVQDGDINASSIGHGITPLSTNQNILEIANSIPSGGILFSVGEQVHATNANKVGIHINYNGNIGVGKLASSNFFDVAGSVTINSLNAGTFEKNLSLGNLSNLPDLAVVELYTKDDGGYGNVKIHGRRHGMKHYWTRGSDSGDKTIMYLGSSSGGTNLALFDPDSVRSINFSSNNNSYFNSTHNLGIGTTSPQAKLHVNGNARFNQEIQLGTDHGGIYYDASTVGEANRGLVFQEKLSNQRGFHFLNSSGNELMRILGNGSVGIGTTIIPAEFKLVVAGKMLTEKVVVRKEENWNWPDFVFHKNYQLPELSDVEAFINANNHLPEIPSAKEIEANGQDLAEMNRLLLKKVEELTLHLINQNKKITQQDDKINFLQSEMEKFRLITE